MRTHVDQSRLALAQAKFAPVALALDRVAREVEKHHAVELKPRGRMQQTAQNAFAVRYSLRHPDEARLSLTFILVGDDADLMLLQSQERVGPPDARANPGRFDQRVYRLGEIDAIKQAVQEKISAHLGVREARH